MQSGLEINTSPRAESAAVSVVARSTGLVDLRVCVNYLKQDHTIVHSGAHAGASPCVRWWVGKLGVDVRFVCVPVCPVSPMCVPAPPVFLTRIAEAIDAVVLSAGGRSPAARHLWEVRKGALQSTRARTVGVKMSGLEARLSSLEAAEREANAAEKAVREAEERMMRLRNRVRGQHVARPSPRPTRRRDLRRDRRS